MIDDDCIGISWQVKMSKKLPDFRFSRLLSRICFERLTRNERRKTRPTLAGSIDFLSFDRKKFFISVRFIIELLFDYRFGFLHARALSKIGSEFLSLPCSATDWPQNIHIFVFIVFLTQFQNIYGTICLSLVFVSLSVCHSARFLCLFLHKCVFAAPHFLCCLINVRENLFHFFLH